MRDSICFISVSLCLLLAGTAVFARERGILASSENEPLQVSAGEIFSFEVALPTALTPPPGVQKASVWREWHLYASRKADAAFGNTSRHLSYELRLLRIRPGRQNVNYVVFAEALHWLPDGKYDLTLRGPGFSYAAPNSFYVGNAKEGMFSGTVKQLTKGKWSLAADDSTKEMNHFFLVVDDALPAFSVSLNGRRTTSIQMFFATHRLYRSNRGRRLVMIDIPWSAGETVVDVAPHNGSPGTVTISAGIGDIRPLEWKQVFAATSFKPVNLIWRFVDGDSRVGNAVTYRWMVGTEAFAEVAAFDESGKVHTAILHQALTMPLSRGAKSCTFAATKSEHPSICLYLFEICVESFINLME